MGLWGVGPSVGARVDAFVAHWLRPNLETQVQIFTLLSSSVGNLSHSHSQPIAQGCWESKMEECSWDEKVIVDNVNSDLDCFIIAFLQFEECVYSLITLVSCQHKTGMGNY